MIQYVAYIDDSGNSPSEEWFVLAGWVAPFPDWFYFSKDWVKRLKETPAIDYFKHSEAMGKGGCFSGFSEKQINDKVRHLVEVISKYKELEPYCVTVKHKVYKEQFLGRGALLGAKIKNYENQALYLAFHNIIPLILQDHLDRELGGRIDFIFDDGKKPSKAARKCVQWYNEMKISLKEQNHLYCDLMGKAETDEDQEMKPLQAADCLAGQLRQSLIYGGYMPLPLRDMLNNRRRAINLELSEDMLAAVYPALFPERKNNET